MDGNVAAARSELDGLVPAALSPGGAIIAAWAVSRVGPKPLAVELLERLLAVPAEFVVDPVPYGPTSLAIGQMHAVLGDLAAAAEELRTAVAVGDRRAPLWGALARVELARVLRCAEAVGAAAVSPRDGESERTVMAAQTFLTAGGYVALTRRLEADVIGTNSGGPTRGVLIPGERWTVSFGIEPVSSVRPSKGLTAIRHLVQHRHRSVPAVELARLLAGQSVDDLLEPGVIDDVDGPQNVERLRSVFIDDGARSRVSKLLRRTIDKLGESHGLLAEHLDASVSTGYTCRYVAAGTREPTWLLAAT